MAEAEKILKAWEPTQIHFSQGAVLLIGHLEPGSVVAYRAEVSLTVLEGVKTERYIDEQGNFRIRGY